MPEGNPPGGPATSSTVLPNGRPGQIVTRSFERNTPPRHVQIKAARQRLTLCRLMFDIMRSLHGAYAPDTEPFGTRLETFFVGLCVALGQLDGRPFSIAKIAAYMRVPRTTVMRRLKRLEGWGLIYRAGRHYYVHETALNSLRGLRSYQQIRRILKSTTDELTALDILPD